MVKVGSSLALKELVGVEVLAGLEVNQMVVYDVPAVEGGGQKVGVLYAASVDDGRGEDDVDADNDGAADSWRKKLDKFKRGMASNRLKYLDDDRSDSRPIRSRVREEQTIRTIHQADHDTIIALCNDAHSQYGCTCF